MNPQIAAPTSARAAATKNDPDQPMRWASIGVSDATTVPPSCPPVLMMPATAPAEALPMSALSAQKQLMEKYRQPDPAASTTLASRASATRVAAATNTPATPLASPPTPQRPLRLPKRQ